MNYWSICSYSHTKDLTFCIQLYRTLYTP